jgi:hypothetical protein
MLRRFALLLPLLALAAAPAAAEEVTITTTVYETAAGTVTETVETTTYFTEGGSERFVAVQPAPVPHGIARFGPFRVLDEGRVALVDVTDADSPAQFAALLAAHPGIASIELIECPGTEDDRANLRLGRMIRARGLATHVPAGGSVRSGGVELFLAGTTRIADPGAEFAVHSWEDDLGRQAGDYTADAPENRKYLDYYREMGMSDAEAARFYAMTNAVPFEQATWFGADEMGRWVRLDQPRIP